MTKYIITAEDFKSIIDWQAMVREEQQKGNCKIGVRHGTYSGIDGHESCRSCPGNYYNGGECNYGGRHVLANETAQINTNFGSFDSLYQRHNALKLSTGTSQEAFEQEKANLLNDFNRAKDNCTKPSCFNYANCIGVDGDINKHKFVRRATNMFNELQKALGRYIQQIENLAWHQVQEFQRKLKQIEEAQQENKQFAEQIKNTDDPQEKARLMALINKNNKKINDLANELKKHPAASLFDENTSDILRDIKKNIFCNHPSNKNPFSGLGSSKGNPDLSKIINRGNGSTGNNSNNNNNQNSPNAGEAFLSPQNATILKRLSLGILVIGILGITYAILKSKLKGTT